MLGCNALLKPWNGKHTVIVGNLSSFRLETKRLSSWRHLWLKQGMGAGDPAVFSKTLEWACACSLPNIDIVLQ